MTRTEMLARARIFLDESVEDFYLDDEEIYPAFTEAQREVLSTVANIWRAKIEAGGTNPVPKAIQSMIKRQTATIGIGSRQFTVSDMIVPVSVLWNSAGTITNAFEGERCLPVTQAFGEQARRNLLIEAGHYYWIYQTNGIELNPLSTDSNATYILDYISEISSDMDASTDSELDEVAHDAIISRALWILLKDREGDQAQLHLQMFSQQLQGLAV